MIPYRIREIANELNCDLAEFEDERPLNFDDLIDFITVAAEDARTDQLITVEERFAEIFSELVAFRHEFAEVEPETFSDSTTQTPASVPQRDTGSDA